MKAWVYSRYFQRKVEGNKNKICFSKLFLDKQKEYKRKGWEFEVNFSSLFLLIKLVNRAEDSNFSHESSHITASPIFDFV